MTSNSNKLHIRTDLKKKLESKNITYQEHFMDQLTKEDYQKFDYIVGIDHASIQDMSFIFRTDQNHKVVCLLDFTDHSGDMKDLCVFDWDETYKNVVYGLEKFLFYLLDKNLEENKQILFAIFHDIIDIVTIEKGYHLRYKFKVITKEKEYFVKIHNHFLSDQEIKKHKILYQYFETCHILIVPLLDIKNIQNKTIFIYEFKYWKSLSEANFSFQKNFDYGRKIGKDIFKLHQITNDKQIFKKFDLEKYYNRDVKRFMKTENEYRVLNLFTDMEKRELINLFYNIISRYNKGSLLCKS